MLPIIFIGQNFHFAISLFASLVTFAVFWLHFDAWGQRKELKELAKFLGYLFLSTSFLIQAVLVEEVKITQIGLFGTNTEFFVLILRTIAYLTIIWALLIDPFPVVPKMEGLQLGKKKKSLPKEALFFPFIPVIMVLKALMPLGPLVIAFLYLLRATKGLERHLKKMALSFVLFTIFEFLSALIYFLRDSKNPIISEYAAPFSVLWIFQHLFLFLAAVTLGRWVWSYLVTRLQSQLFMIFTSSVLVIFLLVTVSFTFLVLNQIQTEALANLKTAASVLDYSIGTKKAESVSNAQSVAQNPEIVAAVKSKDHDTLVTLTQRLMENKQSSSLVITDESGQVIVRGEDSERWGDSLSSDSLVKRALIGQDSSTIVAKEQGLRPLVSIRSATPLREANRRIVGTVTTGVDLDEGFVDGLKNSTGLDSSIYAGNVRSATTFRTPDGRDRWIGVKEEDKALQSKVLVSGETFEGSREVLNVSYLSVYAPLKDVTNTSVGMIFIGRPEISIFETANRFIQITFALAALLLAVSIVPTFLISKHIVKQLT